jgi:hypothetical protein
MKNIIISAFIISFLGLAPVACVKKDAKCKKEHKKARKKGTAGWQY